MIRLLNAAFRRAGLTSYDYLLPAGPVAKVRQGWKPLLLILGAFGFGYGYPIYKAIAYITPGGDAYGQQTTSGSPMSSAVGLAPSLMIFAGLAFVYLFPWRGQRWITPRQSGLAWPGSWRESSWLSHLGTGSLVTIASLVSFVIASEVLGEDSNYPVDWANINGWTIAGLTISFVFSGFQEEILLVGVLVFLMRRSGFGWTAIVVVGCLMRISFHVYYGWTAAFLVIWAATAIIAYAKTGRLVGIIVVHSLWNLRGLSNLAGSDAAVTVTMTFVIGMVLLAIWAPVITRKRQDRRSSMSHPA